MGLDPVTLAVLKGRLEQIADEMDATLFRSAFNPIIAEAHDASHGIYDARTGETLAQGKSGLPIFVGVMAFGVKVVIEKADTVADGDVWVFNEPYEGGTHLSDIRLVRPLIRDGEVFCWLASVGHWRDLGGAVPGNYNPQATECFQEAVVIPPVRLFAEGELRQDVVDILLANSRLPDSAYGDLMGQINALDLGVRRMEVLLDEYGDLTVAGAMQALRDRAAAVMRAEIGALPDGRVSVEDWLDNDGVANSPLKIALDLEIAGDRLVLDFSRSAPACAGPVNISRSTTIAACYVALKHIFVEVPANGGVLDPIDVIVPDGSILSAERPRPTAGYTETILRLIDVMFQAVAKIAPERAVACAYGTINALSIAGVREGGEPWVMFSFFGGGHGASATGDGLNHGNAPISTASIPPLEIMEAAYPVKFTRWALRDGSGGPGRFRGGLGAAYQIELLEERASCFLFGDRSLFPPNGICGGGPATSTRFTYPGSDGPAHPVMGSKIVGVTLNRGDRVLLETPGGGGFGPADSRDPDAQARDRRLGYVAHSGPGTSSALTREGQRSRNLPG